MEIEVTPDYRITSDEYQYIVEKRVVRKEGSKARPWRAFAYYTGLETAVQGLYDRLLRDSNAATAGELLAEAKQAVGALQLALAPLYQIELREVDHD